MLGLLVNIFKFKMNFFKHIIPGSKVNKVFYLFLFACFLSAVFSINFYHSQGVFFDRYILFFISLWAGVWLSQTEKKNIFVFAAVILVWSLFVGIGGIRDYIILRNANFNMGSRLLSFFGLMISYSALPLYLTIYIPVNYYLFVLGKNKWLKYLGLINTCLLIVCLYWNASRIAWMAVLLSMLLVAILKKRKSLTVSLVAVLIFISSLVVFPLMKERVASILIPADWSDRMPLFKSAIKIFRNYPVLGTGIGTFEKVIRLPKYELPSSYPVPRNTMLHAHNTYLEIASEMGIIGLLAFLSIFAVFFFKAFKLLRSNNSDFSNDERAVFMGLVSSVFAVLVFAFGSSIITVGLTVSAYFWFIFGLAAGYLSKKEATVVVEVK